MLRGVVFPYINGSPVRPKDMFGHILYDPDARYIITEETVDTNKWV